MRLVNGLRSDDGAIFVVRAVDVLYELFGYGVELVGNGLPVYVATPSKALCDFLYLNSQYDTPEEIEALRLDTDVLEEISHDSALDGVVARFGSQALARRIRLVKEVYAI